MMRAALILCLLPVVVLAEPTEAELNRAFCDSVGGQTEVRLHYSYGEGQTGYVVVDCLTDRAVYEMGLDKRSSLDSLQQVLFFSYLTGKAPKIVIFNLDNRVGPYEHQILQAGKKAGVFVKIIQPSMLEQHGTEGQGQARSGVCGMARKGAVGTV